MATKWLAQPHKGNWKGDLRSTLYNNGGQWKYLHRGAKHHGAKNGPWMSLVCYCTGQRIGTTLCCDWQYFPQQTTTKNMIFTSMSILEGLGMLWLHFWNHSILRRAFQWCVFVPPIVCTCLHTARWIFSFRAIILIRGTLQYHRKATFQEMWKVLLATRCQHPKLDMFFHAATVWVGVLLCANIGFASMAGCRAGCRTRRVMFVWVKVRRSRENPAHSPRQFLFGKFHYFFSPAVQGKMQMRGLIWFDENCVGGPFQPRIFMFPLQFVRIVGPVWLQVTRT